MEIGPGFFVLAAGLVGVVAVLVFGLSMLPRRGKKAVAPMEKDGTLYNELFYYLNRLISTRIKIVK